MVSTGLSSSRESELVRKLRATSDALRASEARFRSMIINNADGIIIVDNTGGFRFLNPAAEELFGRPAAGLIGRNFGFPTVAGTTTEIDIRHADGSTRLVQMRVAATDWEEQPCALATLRDITEQRALENEVETARRLESTGLLAAGIAHDFNNLLFAITGNLTLARMDLNDNADPRSSLDDVMLAAKKAQVLAEQFLCFSKSNQPRLETTSIESLIRDTVRLVLSGSRSRCEFSICDNFWMSDVDPSQITQVVSNLLINADQAMPDGGVIRISGDNVMISRENQPAPLQPGPYVCCTIADTGRGIPPADLERVFEPFFTTKARGTGLGLAGSKKIVEEHGGAIVAASEPGIGSSFTLYLPSIPEATGQLHEHSEVTVPGSGRILVLEDEAPVRKTLERALNRLGYTVALCRNGHEALEKYEKAISDGAPFVAGILDLTISGGVGAEETIGHLHRIEPDFPAILTSGYSNDPTLREYSKLGFSAALRKPYSIARLSQILAALVSEGERPQPEGDQP